MPEIHAHYDIVHYIKGRNFEDINKPVKLEFQLQQSLMIPLSYVSLTQSAQKV